MNYCAVVSVLSVVFVRVCARVLLLSVFVSFVTESPNVMLYGLFVCGVRLQPMAQTSSSQARKPIRASSAILRYQQRTATKSKRSSDGRQKRPRRMSCEWGPGISCSANGLLRYQQRAADKGDREKKSFEWGPGT